jgi:NAD+ synthase (glutamine-hydrolysing)
LPTLRVALAQIDVTVGDLDGNARRILEYVDKARALKADIVAFPELAVTGYPPEDLVFKRQFVRDNIARMERIVEGTGDIAVVLGFVDRDGDHVYNAAAVAYGGRLVDVYRKVHLPNYSVFDEVRYFEPGTSCPVYLIGGVRVGVNVCEDIWFPDGPVKAQSQAGAQLIVNINGSPYYGGRLREREEMLAARVRDNGVFVAYVNLVGGQDELVFDGASLILAASGDVVARGSQFEEELIVADLDLPEQAGGDGPEPVAVSKRSADGDRPALPDRQPKLYDPAGEVYAALVLGTRDYVTKCGFDKAVVALSGGIDSTLVAAIAVDALGADRVVGVSMPSRFSSEGSVLDARALSENMGFELRTIPIEDSFGASLGTLGPHFEGTEWGIAEENLQSRIRGNLIMALSNKFGWLVLTTGNKSEMATGYATIYGDMAGGFAVIKDVPKTLAYELAKYRNTLADTAVIPQTVIEKPPSAELRPDQKDEDSLPPYSTLDPILKAYVEDDRPFEEIVGMGFEPDVVKQVIGLVDRSEYKRRQSPPGIRITRRNFGRDRRMPIANRYRPF